MPTTTTRLALTNPIGADNPSQIRLAATANNAILDQSVTYTQGTLASLPSPSLAGRRYFATDINQELYDTGTSWLPVGTPVPIGTIMQFAGAGDPVDADGVTRWMVANGRNTLLRATYASLFNLIGINYGAGVDGTKFALPNLQGRVPVGAGTGPGLTARALYAASGEENHKNLSTETGMLSHNHGGATGTGATGGANTGGESNTHVHDINALTTFASSCTVGPAGFSSVVPQVRTTEQNVTGHTHSVPSLSVPSLGISSQAAADAAVAHNNMQPYLVVNHIIKVL